MLETTIAEAYNLQLEVPTKDTGVGACLLQHGEFARAELDFIIEACAGDLIDVGANVGAICLPFAKTRPDARVTAIEAHPGFAEILRRNIHRNALGNVDVVQAIAGEQRAWANAPVAPLDAAANLGASSLYTTGRPMQRLPMVTLDSLSANHPQLVKVDVEGFEPRVLEGATELLNSVRPAWLVEVTRQRPKTADAVFRILSSAGYRMWWFFSPFLTPKGPGGEVTGDFAIYASDSEPPWNLPEFEMQWPTSIAAFPALRRYWND